MMSNIENTVKLRSLPSSFRDPSGYVFQTIEGEILRSLMPSFAEHWDACVDSGFLHACLEQKLIPSFKEVTPLPNTWKTLSVEKIPYITYPYEWSFSQLKRAALLTLKMQKIALEHSLIIKDASAYNVQFIGAMPVFIDLLSFEKYKEGAPWQAYAQFCRHFLAPLLLMCKVSPDSNKLLISSLDGIALDTASAMLPWSSHFNPSIHLHIFMHAKSQKKHSDPKHSSAKMKDIRISKKTLFNLVDSLQACIRNLHLPKYKTTWGDYYNDTNYSQIAFTAKHELIDQLVQKFSPNMMMDLGANEGEFSSIAAKHAGYIISPDIDPIAVNTHHQALFKYKKDTILPMLLDISNPSPSIGWQNEERCSFIERTQVDLCQALALIHHLAIGNNIPLDKIAHFFAQICTSLILEFVPKTDSQVQRMLSAREDIFPEYSLENCQQSFEQYFNCTESIPVQNSERTMLVMTLRK